jgi:hypothetical protein
MSAKRAAGRPRDLADLAVARELRSSLAALRVDALDELSRE